jgi:hypothetical protein
VETQRHCSKYSNSKHKIQINLIELDNEVRSSARTQSSTRNNQPLLRSCCRPLCSEGSAWIMRTSCRSIVSFDRTCWTRWTLMHPVASAIGYRAVAWILLQLHIKLHDGSLSIAIAIDKDPSWSLMWSCNKIHATARYPMALATGCIKVQRVQQVRSNDTIERHDVLIIQADPSEHRGLQQLRRSGWLLRVELCVRAELRTSLSSSIKLIWILCFEFEYFEQWRWVSTRSKCETFQKGSGVWNSTRGSGVQVLTRSLNLLR